MSFRKELHNYYSSAGKTEIADEISISDGILIKRGNIVEKIPVSKCKEEVHIIKIFQSLGIPTVDILSIEKHSTPLGLLESYVMKKLKNVKNVIMFGNFFLNEEYYCFLNYILESLKQINFDGFGSISIQDNNIIDTEFSTEKELFGKIIASTKRRANIAENELVAIEKEIEVSSNSKQGFLVHSDILNNILVVDDKDFLLIDPQTNVSSANEYWDLSMYLIYAYAFGCMRGLSGFFRNCSIPDYEKFLTTARVLAYERLSYYKKYDKKRVIGIEQFLYELNRNF